MSAAGSVLDFGGAYFREMRDGQRRRPRRARLGRYGEGWGGRQVCEIPRHYRDIARLTHHGQPVKAVEVAEAIGITPRTLRRELRRMEGLGIVAVSTTLGRYGLTTVRWRRPVRWDDV